MTVNGSDKLTPAKITQFPGKGEAKRLRLLAVVDGTELTNRIVDFIISFGEGRSVTEVVILNVQSKRADARLRGYQNFMEEEINDRLLSDLALPIVNSVSKKLQAAGITCLSKVAIGDPFSVISDCAREHSCNLILVGKRSRTAVGRVIPQLLRMWLESRLALKLVTLAPTSVVVVK